MLDWTKEELKSIGIKTRKLITMNCSLNPRRMLVDCIFQEEKDEEGL